MFTGAEAKKIAKEKELEGISGILHEIKKAAERGEYKIHRDTLLSFPIISLANLTELSVDRSSVI